MTSAMTATAWFSILPALVIILTLTGAGVNRKPYMVRVLAASVIYLFAIHTIFSILPLLLIVGCSIVFSCVYLVACSLFDKQMRKEFSEYIGGMIFIVVIITGVSLAGTSYFHPGAMGDVIGENDYPSEITVRTQAAQTVTNYYELLSMDNYYSACFYVDENVKKTWKKDNMSCEEVLKYAYSPGTSTKYADAAVRSTDVRSSGEGNPVIVPARSIVFHKSKGPQDIMLSVSLGTKHFGNPTCSILNPLPTNFALPK